MVAGVKVDKVRECLDWINCGWALLPAFQVTLLSKVIIEGLGFLLRFVYDFITVDERWYVGILTSVCQPV